MFFFFVKFYGIIFFGLVFELRFGLSSTKYLIGWHADRHCVSMVYGKWSLWMPINWAFMLMKKTISNGNDKKMMMMYIDGLDDDGDGISIFFFFYTAPPKKTLHLCSAFSLLHFCFFFSLFEFCGLTINDGLRMQNIQKKNVNIIPQME